MTNAAAPASTRPFHPLDISDSSFWERPFFEREKTFARLREEEGVTWHRPAESLFPHDESGYWAITRHADIRHVSGHPELFCSSAGISMDPMPAEIQCAISFFLTMDPPEHTRYRRLISMAFTPKQVRTIEAQIQANAKAIVDDFLRELDKGAPVDFVQAVSRHLPMRTVSEMIGIAPENHEAVAYAAESLFSTSDDEYANLEERATHLMTQLGILTGSGVELAKERRVNPQDDLMTNIVQAEVDGHRLTDEEVGAFMVLLASAGNDTTKQATSHCFKALIDNPDQVAWLLDDWDERASGAIDEFVRWSTPVLEFARHAVVDTDIAGTPIRAGEKVVLFYCSGNFDEMVFDRPLDFDLSRFPNPHVGFGGGGPHFCLGKQLAVLELKHLFHELLTRIPPVELSEPEYVRSDFVHGIKRMSVRKL
ncbi:cytochrome P450 [Rhodococcus artemisiae]|uniref:Cytochrome P450 n=1 Tax=Rhodococcus artemisiae TaxID=714159 RepID=A0ABU7LB65_9NOCA|nr:cytochrome P450 [Rhodococcus artemisiae]MEE2058552.1 cytochrome P450 [Rhodococcus artemisiae]